MKPYEYVMLGAGVVALLAALTLWAFVTWRIWAEVQRDREEFARRRMNLDRRTERWRP